MERFANKIAIVTGAGSGIGKGIAYRLGKERATVALIDNNKAALEIAVSELTKAGIDAHGYPTDISSEEEVSKTVEAIEEKWGAINVMVHAAGIVGPTSTNITDYPTAEFDK
jgi:NAD(P)-dependent dehydrogenase (short-subunit alcohol dehydrogenase family)